ncbi:MAG TPA: glutamate racemase [Chloroflexota bacterium]|nr:glutamate racemase [Chloroflexota bacterium]
MEGDRRPVGVLDSGLGGVSVLRHLRRLVPGEGIVYAADTAWCPYGPRPAGEVRARVESVVQSLQEREAKLVVLACNSASTVALETLRRRWPRLPFVGTEPAVKPAALRSRTGRVGVLATSTTARGAPLARLIERFADTQGVTVEVAVPEGLVELVERGEGNSGAAEEVLRPILEGWQAVGVDVVVLGCTHFPFARRAIERLVTQPGGNGMEVLDPAPAVARQAVRLLDGAGALAPAGSAGGVVFLTSGDATAFRGMLGRLWPAGRALLRAAPVRPL